AQRGTKGFYTSSSSLRFHLCGAWRSWRLIFLFAKELNHEVRKVQMMHEGFSLLLLLCVFIFAELGDLGG
ncbi:MAG: hypothetical protein ACR2KB_13995, partial [Chitinophagaceae bacterium]